MPKIDKRLKNGEAAFRSSGNLLFLKWMNKEEVYMLSTMHSAELKTVITRRGERVI